MPPPTSNATRPKYIEVVGRVGGGSWWAVGVSVPLAREHVLTISIAHIGSDNGPHDVAEDCRQDFVKPL